MASKSKLIIKPNKKLFNSKNNPTPNKTKKKNDLKMAGHKMIYTIKKREQLFRFLFCFSRFFRIFVMLNNLQGG